MSIAREVLPGRTYNRAFREAYAAAREAFIAGARDVIFPAGTYWLRRFTRGARVASS